MNKQLKTKCDRLISKAKDNTLFYDDVIKEISKNKTLIRYSCTVSNALEYISKANISIVNELLVTKLDNEDTFIDSTNNIDNSIEDLEDSLFALEAEEAAKLTAEITEDTLQSEKELKSLPEFYSTDGFSQYFKKVALEQPKLLTAEEEKTLCIAAQNGDIEARNKMVTYNLKLVVSTAKRYAYVSKSMEFLDLIQSGNIGLINAIDKFDPEKGCKFSTYATWWIRQAIIRALSNESRVIRLPAHAVEQLRYIYTAIRDIQLENGNEDTPTYSEIADYCNVRGLIVKTCYSKRGLSEKDVELYMRLSDTSNVISLHTPIGQEGPGEERFIGDFLPDDSISVEDIVAASDTQTIVNQILDTCLKPKEAEVIRMRFGFDGYSPMTLEEIGNIIGVTRERIRQIEDKAKNKIRIRASKMHLFED